MGARVRLPLLGFATALLLLAGVAGSAADPLSTWNEAPPKSALVQFVTRVTTQGAPEFVPQSECIAVFDNDGTHAF
jgi:hypothetical protein